MLIIDEHTAMEGRHIFDQDNKGWKAVSNAIKGRLIPDDDQHISIPSARPFEGRENNAAIQPAKVYSRNTQGV